MMDPKEALFLTLEGVRPLESEKISLAQGLGRVLAADIHAPVDHPFFDQTAVDGYAFRFADWIPGQPLRVTDHIQAGDRGDRELGKGECSRIFTGAPLPPGADTCVMQEHTQREDDRLLLQDQGLRRGGNVRLAGEQIRMGGLALAQGHRLNAAGIGFLASLGIKTLHVTTRPRVQVIVTGDEFADSQAEFRKGLIYESNGVMLMAALQARGLAATYHHCKDDLDALAGLVRSKAGECDLLILTGGVSVGDFDFSRPALEANGFKVIFHQVAQKPGKPLLYGACEEGRAFGLPGNPRAVLMCYYLYVLPLLDQMEGCTVLGLPTLLLPLQEGYRRKPDGKTHFVTGQMEAGTVRLGEGQQSHMLQSFAEAACIVELPADPAEFHAGDVLRCYLL